MRRTVSPRKTLRYIIRILIGRNKSQAGWYDRYEKHAGGGVKSLSFTSPPARDCNSKCEGGDGGHCARLGKQFPISSQRRK